MRCCFAPYSSCGSGLAPALPVYCPMLIVHIVLVATAELHKLERLEESPAPRLVQVGRIFIFSRMCCMQKMEMHDFVQDVA